MKKLMNLLLTLVSWGAAAPVARRAWTCDAANETSIKFRMDAGFPGDINRAHPFSAPPCLIDVTLPPTAYGQPVIIDSDGNAVRRFDAADQNATATLCWGFTIRPYPTQQTSGGMSSSFGSATPPVTGVIDVLRWGYIIGRLNDVTASPKKGDTVYVWCAATNGIHIQGGLEVVASGGNTVPLANAQFNGPGDAKGNVEVIVTDRR
jgi:hypothetical protein